MENKKYSSYNQIEHDLEILKVEKEIHYKRMLLSIEKTKESILPSKTISFVNTIYEKSFFRKFRHNFKDCCSLYIQLVFKQKKRRLKPIF